MSVSHEVLVERVTQEHERVSRHKSDADRDLAKLEGRLDGHDEELADIDRWRAKLLGMVAIVLPLTGVVTTILIHFMEKGWK